MKSIDCPRNRTSWAVLLFGVTIVLTGCQKDEGSVVEKMMAEEQANSANADSSHGSESDQQATDEASQKSPPPGEAPEGMVWIPGGQYQRGSTDPLANQVEQPVHEVRVDGFWMDETEVTNAQFSKFVEETGYVTVAEKAPTMEEIMKQLPPGSPQPDADLLVAASMVFVPTEEAVPLDRFDLWWSWVPGANWRHPEGPDSDLQGREDHPVVHVCFEDAMAYCKWAGKRLPTEAEWERAARGGMEGKQFVWGSAALSETNPQVNIWQGPFPHANSLADGYMRTAPAKSFSRNGYGLYHMSGNVWEWCSDWYRPDTYARYKMLNVIPENPAGPDKSYDPSEPYTPKRVLRGGSFLCSDSYCSAYRPSARRGQSMDTGMSHLGFRCVKSPGDQQAIGPQPENKSD